VKCGSLGSLVEYSALTILLPTSGSFLLEHKTLVVEPSHAGDSASNYFILVLELYCYGLANKRLFHDIPPKPL
jgi:hypothetical protein